MIRIYLEPVSDDEVPAVVVPRQRVRTVDEVVVTDAELSPDPADLTAPG